MPSVAKRFEGSSTYERDFGPLGCDPMQLATSNPSMQTLLASTRELNEGTTRGCKQPAGYGGFMPAAATNPVALQQAAGLTSRPDAKVREGGTKGRCVLMFNINITHGVCLLFVFAGVALPDGQPMP